MKETAKDTKKGNAAEPRRFFSRPADTSLAAYKEWIRGMVAALRAQADLPVKVDNMTEEDWVRSWRHFWNGPEKENRQLE